MKPLERIKYYTIKYFNNPGIRFVTNSKLGLYNRLSDREYLEKAYKAYLGFSPDFDNPKRFTEKLQCIKLYDRNPMYTDMVDKYTAKQYVAERIGEEHIIPLLGVWDDANDVDFDALPDKFVLKCTHDSGPIICTDKSTFDKESAIKKLKSHLKTDYSKANREWPYKNVRRRVIAEKYMVDEKTAELRDYKFFCFNGKVKCFKIDFDRFIEHKANYYDTDGNPMMFGEVVCPPDYTKTLQMPKNLDKMIEYAEKLSNGIAFLRVDFYEVNDKIYFGEMTFFPNSGLGIFTDDKWDYTFGEWMELPPKREENE